MKLTRKSFLRSVGIGSLGLLGLRARAGESAPEKIPALPAYSADHAADFWRAVRAQYDLDPKRAYLNTGGLGPSPRRVTADYAATMARLQHTVETGHGLHAEARQSLAAFLGARPGEITFTRNATEGNSIIAAGLDLRAGDEVIFESHAHAGGAIPWMNQAKLRGVVIKIFEPDATAESGNLERIAALITPRTRVIQVSHITAPTGLLLPVGAIARLAKERGVWFHVDGAQSAGMVPVDLHALDCDSYATSGHKWLGGPRETGVLYIRAARTDEVRPVHIGAHSFVTFDLHVPMDFVAGAPRHEYGTRNAAALVALATAARFQEEVGRARIAAYGSSLARRVQAGVTGLRGVRVLTSTQPGLQCSMVTFAVEGWPADKLFGALHERHALRCRSVTEAGLQALRVSTHLFNDEEQCDRVIAAVRQLVGA